MHYIDQSEKTFTSLQKCTFQINAVLLNFIFIKEALHFLSWFPQQASHNCDNYYW